MQIKTSNFLFINYSLGVSWAILESFQFQGHLRAIYVKAIFF